MFQLWVSESSAPGVPLELFSHLLLLFPGLEALGFCLHFT